MAVDRDSTSANDIKLAYSDFEISEVPENDRGERWTKELKLQNIDC